MFSSCAAEDTEQNRNFFFDFEQSISEKEVEAKVTHLISRQTTHDNETLDGNTECYVVLKDCENISYRFRVNEEDFHLFEKGRMLKIEILSYNPPNQLRSTEFFWNDVPLFFDADVTNVSAEG
jgi:hypothetical protein